MADTDPRFNKKWLAFDDWRHMRWLVVVEPDDVDPVRMRAWRPQESEIICDVLHGDDGESRAQGIATDHNDKLHFRASLQDIKASIEWAVNPSIGGQSHFTVNRPMADLAQIYALTCNALVSAPSMHPEHALPPTAGVPVTLGG